MASTAGISQMLDQIGNGDAHCYNYETMDNNGCPVVVRNQCVKYEYEDDILTDTARTEFNLFCGRSYIVRFLSTQCAKKNKLLLSHMQSVQLAGLIMGSMVFGSLGDTIGRKLSILISCLGASLSSICVYLFSFNAFWYTFFRLLSLIFIAGSVPTTLVYAVEFVGAKYRSYVGGLAYIIFDIGLASLSIIPLIITGWRNQALVLSMLPLAFVILYFILPKSLDSFLLFRNLF